MVSKDSLFSTIYSELSLETEGMSCSDYSPAFHGTGTGVLKQAEIEEACNSRGDCDGYFVRSGTGGTLDEACMVERMHGATVEPTGNRQGGVQCC